MIPGPANILSCPYCGGKKSVMSLISGNTIGATVWSDTRRHYPMLPEVSPIQQCPHCFRFYFIEQAAQSYSVEDHSEVSSFGELGTLDFDQLKMAKKQMKGITLTKMQRWILNHQIFMAYNDKYQRGAMNENIIPDEEDRLLFENIVEELLDGIEEGKDYELFHAELLREAGRFEESRAVLSNITDDSDEWIVKAMIRQIENGNKIPFLLIEGGNCLWE